MKTEKFMEHNNENHQNGNRNQKGETSNHNCKAESSSLMLRKHLRTDKTADKRQSYSNQFPFEY